MSDNDKIQPNDIPLVGGEDILDPATGHRTPAERPEVMPGDIVQLSPNKTGNRALAGCMMVVTNVAEWGIVGYVKCPSNSSQVEGKLSLYVAAVGSFEATGGKTVWVENVTYENRVELKQ